MAPKTPLSALLKARVPRTTAPAAGVCRKAALGWYSSGRGPAPKTTTTRTKRSPTPRPDDEDEPMSARVPLRKPSTGGLGVPGKSPSPPPGSRPPGTGRTGRTDETASPLSRPGVVGDANNASGTERSNPQAGRLRRVHEEAALAREKEAARDYEERYKSAEKRWVRSIIAMPILLVTSWYLFDRLALGNQPKPLPKAADREDD